MGSSNHREFQVTGNSKTASPENEGSQNQCGHRVLRGAGHLRDCKAVFPNLLILIHSFESSRGFRPLYCTKEKAETQKLQGLDGLIVPPTLLPFCLIVSIHSLVITRSGRIHLFCTQMCVPHYPNTVMARHLEDCINKEQGYAHRG